MTYEEALKKMKEIRMAFNITREFKSKNEMFEFLKNRTELAIIIEALKKQIPKKYEIWNGQDCCPNCKALFGSDETRKHLISWKMDYCKYCGQKLNWSDE